ncbi:HAD-IA family hydrolase [Candidatus Woesearchaeota archaeon]|nr:HAD-IA family hydrolase [Candidatus Woesearchaeota archaeon]
MRWIIFDFDEVISATGDGFTTFLERINERIPVDVAKGAAWMREQWKHFATHAWDEHELLSRMNRFLGVEIPFALFDEAFHHTIFPSEEVIRVIALLKKRGYKVALLTDNARIRLEKIAAHPALKGLFDHVTGSSLLGSLKTDRATFLRVCAQLRIRPEEALLVDDNAAHCENARSVGMDALQFQIGARNAERLIESLASHGIQVHQS